MSRCVQTFNTFPVISGRWEMPLGLTLTCVLEFTLGMFSAVWLASRNGSMMFGHMTSPWPITWRQGVYLGKISIWLLFFPISEFSHICYKCYYAHGGFLTLIEMFFWKHNECAFVLLMNVPLNNPKHNRNAKGYIHFSYLNSIVSAGFGTFVKYSYNAPVFVKCPFICQSVIVSVLLSRRVHISSVTLEHLKGAYKVEPGNGLSRDCYLKEHGIITYLVINPKVKKKSHMQKVILVVSYWHKWF